VVLKIIFGGIVVNVPDEQFCSHMVSVIVMNLV
jgi:hypothetical protein